jgi:site-specific DNA-cytosine methylase
MCQLLGYKSILFHSCESEPFKQRHLSSIVHDALGATNACLFNDLGHLCQGSAPCVVHNDDCEVKAHSFLTIIGYSCKTLSKAIPIKKSSVLATGQGTSGETCHALLKYVSASRPRCLLLENVDEMAKAEEVSNNVQFLHSELRARGFALAVALLNSADYYSPQDRRRAFCFAIDTEAWGMTLEEAEAYCVKMLDLAKSLAHAAPPPLDKFLLNSQDNRLAEELSRRQSSKQSVARAATYVEKHQSYMASKGVSWTRLTAPPATEQSPWFQLLPRREQEIVCFGFAVEPELCMVNVGPRIDRCSIIKEGKLGTITSSTKLYLVKAGPRKASLERLVLGWELLGIQGFPMGLFEAAAANGKEVPSDSQMSDLAGNAFSGGVVCTLLLAIYATLPVFRAKQGNSCDLESPAFEAGAIADLMVD